MAILHILDDTTPLPILTINFKADANAFVSSWKRLFPYAEYDAYEEIVEKPQLTIEDLQQLQQWKDAIELNLQKENVYPLKLENYLVIINQLKSEYNSDIFLGAFKTFPLLWYTFMLHIVSPVSPIFDEHMYRAFSFLLYGEAR